MSQVPADYLSTTSSYNYEPPLPSVARGSTLTKVPPAKKITFFKSGDPQFAGVKMAINQRSFKSFNALMDDLSHRVPLPFGVRTITTPRGIHCISELDQLEDGGCYLCSDKKYVKPISITSGGHRPAPPRNSRPSSTMRRAAQEGKLEDYSTPFTHHGPRIPKKITLVKNGESGFRRSIILNRRNARSFKTLLDEITEILQFPVKKLYTVDGKKIDSMQALLHCPNVLVCVGREPFKPVSMENLRKHSVEKLPNLPPRSNNGNNVNENNEMNFGLKAKKSVIHPRSASSNRSMRFSLSSEKSYPNGLATSPDNGAPFSHPKAGDLVQSLVNDDIEKRVHVNKDGSLSVEMKVRFRLLNDETLQWSTQIKKSNLMNRLPCEESGLEEDSGVDPLQKMNPEASSEADDSLYPCDIDSYMSRLEESECDEAHCHSCGKKHQDYDIWKNPMHMSQREDPSVRSTWHTRSSCSSTSSRRRVVHKKMTSMDSIHTTSSEEFSEHIVRESSSYSETIKNRVAYRSVKKCMCRSDLSTGASNGEEQQEHTRTSTGNSQRRSSLGLMSHSSCENNLDTQDSPEDQEVTKIISENEDANCFEASPVKCWKDDAEEVESSRVGSVMSRSSLQSRQSKKNVCEESSSVGRSVSSSSLPKANQGDNSQCSTPADSVHSKSSNCTTAKAKSEQGDLSDENPVASSFSTESCPKKEAEDVEAEQEESEANEVSSVSAKTKPSQTVGDESSEGERCSTQGSHSHRASDRHSKKSSSDENVPCSVSCSSRGSKKSKRSHVHLDARSEMSVSSLESTPNKKNSLHADDGRSGSRTSVYSKSSCGTKKKSVADALSHKSGSLHSNISSTSEVEATAGPAEEKSSKSTGNGYSESSKSSKKRSHKEESSKPSSLCSSTSSPNGKAGKDHAKISSEPSSSRQGSMSGSVCSKVDHPTDDGIRNGKPTSSSSRVSSVSEIKDKRVLAQTSQETDDKCSQSNMSVSSKSKRTNSQSNVSLSSKSRWTNTNNLHVKVSNSSRASVSETMSVCSLHCPAPPKGKPKRKNLRSTMLKNSSISSIGTESVLTAGNEQKEIVDSSKETSYGSKSAATEVNGQNNKETDDSCNKKAEEEVEDTGVQEEGADLMPSALPNTSPEEVVQEWLRKIPSETLLMKYEMEEGGEEEHAESTTEVSQCTNAEEASEEEKAEEKNEEQEEEAGKDEAKDEAEVEVKDEAEDEAKAEEEDEAKDEAEDEAKAEEEDEAKNEAEDEAIAEVEEEKAEDTAVNEEAEECVKQEEISEVAPEAAEAEQAECNQSVTSSQNNKRDLPTSVQTSVQIMKALLSSKHETKFDRSNSLPEVSPTMGRKLSNSANVLITCLASLQLLDEESEDPSDNSKHLNKSRYMELLNIFQALWFGCTPEKSGPSSGEEASSQAEPVSESKASKSMGHAFTPMSSSGVDVCSGSGGSGEECTGGATLAAQKTAEFKSAEQVENAETGTELTEVEEQSKEEEQPSRPSTAHSEAKGEEKAESVREESVIQEEEENKEDQGSEHGQEEGGENENEEEKLAETGEQEEVEAVNDEVPQEKPEEEADQPATTDDANVGDADGGTEQKDELQEQPQEESPNDPEPKVDTSTRVGTSLVHQNSMDPDPTWVLRLLKKIEKEFMAHYVNAMNEFKVRWNLQDNRQMDQMILELKEEVNKRIQKSIEKELRKIRSRAGRRMPRPPEGPPTRESKAQTEQRRWRLQTMHKKSLFGDKNGAQMLEETTDLSFDVDNDFDLSAALEDSIGKQSSEDEYCPCDSCVRKKLASRPVRAPVVAANAPVMKAFDLQKILRLKKDDNEEAIVAEAVQDTETLPNGSVEEGAENEEKDEGEPPTGEMEAEDDEGKEPELNEDDGATLTGDGEEPEVAESQNAEVEDEAKDEETKEEEEAEEGGEETKEAEEEEAKEEEKEKEEEEMAEAEEEIKEEEEEGETKEDEEVKEEEAEETKEEEELNEEEEKEVEEEGVKEEEETKEEEEEEGKEGEEEAKEKEEEAKEEEEEEAKEEEEEAKEEEEEAKEEEEEGKEEEEEAKEEEEEAKEEEEEAKEEEEEAKEEEEEEEAKEEEEEAKEEEEEEEAKEEEEEAKEEEEEEEAKEAEEEAKEEEEEAKEEEEEEAKEEEEEAKEEEEEAKEEEEEAKEEEEEAKEEEEEAKEEEEEAKEEAEEAKEEEEEAKEEEEEAKEEEEEAKEEEEEAKEEEEEAKEEEEEEAKEEEEEAKEEEEEAKEEEEEEEAKEEEEEGKEDEEEAKEEEEEAKEEEEAQEEEEETKEEDEEEAKAEDEEAKEKDEEEGKEEEEEEAKEEEEGKEEEEEAKEEEEVKEEEEEAKEEEEEEGKEEEDVKEEEAEEEEEQKEEEETKEEEEEKEEEEMKEEEEEVKGEEEEQEEGQNEEQEDEEKTKGEDEGENEAEETEEPEDEDVVADDEAETSECRGDAEGSGTDNNPEEDAAEGNEEAEQDEAEAAEDAKPESGDEAEEKNSEGGEKPDENGEEPTGDDPDKAHEEHEDQGNNDVSEKASKTKGKRISKRLESLKKSTAFSCYSSVGNFSQQSQKGSDDEEERADEEEGVVEEEGIVEEEGVVEEECKGDDNPTSDPPNGEVRSDESSKPSQMYPDSEEEEDKESSGSDPVGEEEQADAEGADPKEAENPEEVQAPKKKENSNEIGQDDLDF